MDGTVKNKLGLIMTSLLLLLTMLFNDSASKVADDGNVYYVSMTDGSDSNDGLSPKSPWKTLGKASSITFQPGDTILLKRGDMWTGEAFYPKGEGTSANWITVSAYGKGDYPKIAPGNDPSTGTYFQWAVYLREGNAGWRFQGIEIANAMNGIVYNDETDAQHDGLWIEDCYFHDIEGGPVHPDPLIPYLSYSAAIAIINQKWENKRLTNVTIQNVKVEKSDSVGIIRGVKGLTVDRLHSHITYRFGLLLERVDNGIVQNSKILWAGYKKGMYWGIAGLQLSSTTDTTVQDTEIAFTQSPNGYPDGVGIDFEMTNINATAIRVNVHDNASSGILIYRNPTYGKDNINTRIIDSIFRNNGLDDPDRIPAFIRHADNMTLASPNLRQISGNTVVKATEGQYLNELWTIPKEGSAAVKTLTNDYPSGYAGTDTNDVSSLDSVKTWDFNDDGQKWGTWQLSGKFELGSWHLAATGPTSALVSPDLIRLNADEDKFIKLRIRNDSGMSRGRIYFSACCGWREENAVSFPVEPYSDFKEYTVFMGNNPEWTQPIRRIMLVFSVPEGQGEAAGNISLDYVKATRTGVIAAYSISDSRDRLKDSFDFGSIPMSVSPVSVSASRSEELAPRTIDGNRSSGWSANGDGQWIAYDLGYQVNLSAINIAWALGHQRRYSFDLLTSTDGVKWTVSAANLRSSGTTQQPEGYPLTVEARYVKIVGHGNTANGFIAINEIELFQGGSL